MMHILSYLIFKSDKEFFITIKKKLTEKSSKLYFILYHYV